MYIYRQPYDNELYHYGVIGMKWGVRRYQNADGTLTEAGKKRYGDRYTDTGEKRSKSDIYERRRMSASVYYANDKARRLEQSNKALVKKIAKDVKKGKNNTEKHQKRLNQLGENALQLVAAKRASEKMTAQLTEKELKMGKRWFNSGVKGVSGLGILEGAVGGAISGGIQGYQSYKQGEEYIKKFMN